jgi:hypothetical protein
MPKDQIFMEKIVGKSGIPDILEMLTERLIGSEFNSLLLEAFSRRVQQISPALLRTNTGKIAWFSQ